MALSVKLWPKNSNAVTLFLLGVVGMYMCLLAYLDIY